MTTQDDINAFNASCDAACLLVLAAQTNNETANRIVKVATINDLPDLTLNTIMPGTVIWVDSLSIPVIAQVGCWTGLDNREVRSDCLVKQAWSWGTNTSGQMGDNTVTAKSSPVIVVGGFTDWCQISGGIFHSAAVKTGGSAWAWGTGRLGDNTNAGKSSPVSVVGGFTDWCQIDTGCGHTGAVRTNGSAWTWGVNICGQLGDNTTTDRSSPVSVVGGFSDWCQISAGGFHSAAIRSVGILYSWGHNGQGRLGDNSVVSKSSPVIVAGGFEDWCQISAGQYRSMAVRTGGSLWAWGPNLCGSFGDNSTTSRSSPVNVLGDPNWRQVSVSNYHTVAVSSLGSAWAWGWNQAGMLGDGTTTIRSSPVIVCGGFSDWCQVSAGGWAPFGFASAAVRTSGSAWAWGGNTSGILGNGTTTARSSPVSVAGGFSDWCQVSMGACHTVALRQF